MHRQTRERVILENVNRRIEVVGIWMCMLLSTLNAEPAMWRPERTPRQQAAQEGPTLKKGGDKLLAAKGLDALQGLCGSP